MWRSFVGLRATARLLPVDKPTQTGRIYSQAMAESIVAQVRERVEAGDFLGTDADMAQDNARVLLNAALFVVHDAWIDDGYVMIAVEFLDTAMGRKVEDVHRKGKLFFTLSAAGTVEDGHVTNVQLGHIVCGLRERLDPSDAGQSDEASDTEDPALASPE